MPIPLSLIEALARGHVVPFVGSGVSLSVNEGLFPNWPQLLRHLAHALDDEARSKQAQIVRLFAELDQLNKAADEALEGLGNAGFTSVMREYFDINPPDEVDLSLVAALWQLQPRLVITTN